jgi:hypothetical protein
LHFAEKTGKFGKASKTKFTLVDVVVVIDIFDFLFTIYPPDPKNSQALGFEVPKFWHSISSDAELLDEDLEEEVEETTTHHEPYPFFDEEQTQLNDTTQLGNDVYLHCRVENLGEKTVSQKSTDIEFSTSTHSISLLVTRYHGYGEKAINCT